MCSMVIWAEIILKKTLNNIEIHSMCVTKPIDKALSVKSSLNMITQNSEGELDVEVFVNEQYFDGPRLMKETITEGISLYITLDLS